MAETLTTLEQEIRGRHVETVHGETIGGGGGRRTRGHRRVPRRADARGTRKETILRLTPDLRGSIQTMIHASNAAIDAGGRA